MKPKTTEYLYDAAVLVALTGMSGLLWYYAIEVTLALWRFCCVGGKNR